MDFPIPIHCLSQYIANVLHRKFFPLFFHIYRLWTLDFGLSYPNTLPIPIHCIPGGYFDFRCALAGYFDLALLGILRLGTLPIQYIADVLHWIFALLGYSIVDFGLWTFLSQYIAYPNTLLMYYIGNFFPLFFHIYRLWTLDFGLSYPNTLPIPIHCIPDGTFSITFRYTDCWTLDFPIPIHCLSQYIANVLHRKFFSIIFSYISIVDFGLWTFLSQYIGNE